MLSTRALVLVALVTVSLVAAPLSVAATPGNQYAAGDVTDASVPVTSLEGTYVGDDDEPSTNGTIGYVEGIRYDDELPVDDRDDAVVEEDELETVVYRSMARVEVLRELPFEGDVPVELLSREEFREENDRSFENLSEEEHLFENARFETLFMVDREADAVEEYRGLYGGAVVGYYDPADDRVVLVSESADPDALEVDEVVLAHELLHALQDQHFDLQRYDRETRDQANAKNGLIEGDAVWIETEYEERCAEEWACLLPADAPSEDPDEEFDGTPSEFNWGIYFTLYQPYSDGPAYVEYLLEDDGWDAVNAAYDDPPASTSEVIRPGEEREPVAIEFEDTSSDDWGLLEVDNETARDSFGEAAMASMFAHGALDGPTGPSVVSREEFLATDEDGYIQTIEYDQPYTDGWAGDEFVVYVTDEETIDESGSVWQTEWTSADDAEAFAEGYLELLGLKGASPVDDYRDTFVIDTAFPGAYYVGVDGEAVTIVRAPTVDDLSEIRDGAAPDGEDLLDFEVHEIETDDEVPGFGVTVALLALLVVALLFRR